LGVSIGIAVKEPLDRARHPFYANAEAEFLLARRGGCVVDRKLARTGVTVRPINMRDFDGEVGRLWGVYNPVLQRNWGFEPMTRDEFVPIGNVM
jgi:hypothetical protein